MSPPSQTSLSPPTPSHGSRLLQSTRFAGNLHSTANCHWLSVLHMVMRMFQCYSLNSSHLLLPPLCPQACSVCLQMFSNIGCGNWKTDKWFLLAFVVICDRGKDLKPNNSRSQGWWENRSNLMAKGNTTYRLNVFTRLWFPLAEITRKFHYVKVFFLPWWFRQNLWWKDPWGLFNSRQAQGTSDPPSKSEN